MNVNASGKDIVKIELALADGPGRLTLLTIRCEPLSQADINLQDHTFDSRLSVVFRSVNHVE